MSESSPANSETQSFTPNRPESERDSQAFSPSAARFADRLNGLLQSDPNATCDLPATRPSQESTRRTGLPEVEGYESIRELGRGGFGLVFEARQIALNRTVAIKVVKDAEASSHDLVRFLEEAEAVASINHPNVIRVYDFGESEGQPYMVMEHLPGGSLADRIKKAGRLTPTEAMATLEKVARGVQAAHSLGIVHRDLKPHNIMLDADGEPKVTDFGLARRGQSRDQSVTGAVIGTPEYMAPEQASGQGKYAGAPADVWALGVILYECLTGVRPFSATTEESRAKQVLVVMRKIVSDSPDSPRRLVPTVPRDLELVCLKCLEKETADRYSTVGELAEDLRRLRHDEPVSVRTASVSERVWKWSRRNKSLAALYAVSIFATLALIGAGFWFSKRIGAADGLALAERTEREAAETREQAAKQKEQQAQELACTEKYHRLLANLRSRENRLQPGWMKTGITSIQDFIREGVPTTANLAELRSETVQQLLGVDLQNPRKLAEMNASAIAYRHDGEWVAIAQSKSQAWSTCYVLLVNPQTGKTVHRLSFPPSQEFQIQNGVQDGPRCATFSRNGDRLLVGTRSGMIHSWNLKQASRPLLSWQAHKDEITHITFAFQGDRVFTAAKDGTVCRWRPNNTKVLASHHAPGAIHTLFALREEQVVCGWVSDKHDQPDTAVLDHANLKPVAQWRHGFGKFVPFPTIGLWCVADRRLVRISDPRHHDARTLRSLFANERDYSHEDLVKHISPSADGRWLATTGDDNHLRIWDLVGCRLLLDTALNFDGNGQLAWQPDGKRLVVTTADRVLAYDVVENGHLQTIPLSACARSVAWSPDGSKLAAVGSAFHLGGAHGGEMVVCDLTKKPVHLDWTPTHEGSRNMAPDSVQFSPNGKQVTTRMQKFIVLSDEKGNLLKSVLPVQDGGSIGWSDDITIWSAAGSQLLSWDIATNTAGPGWSNELSNRLTGKGSINTFRIGRTGILVGTREGTIHLLDRKAQPTRSWNVGATVTAIAFAADESFALVGTELGELLVLPLAEGSQPLHRWKAHREIVSSVVVADNHFITGSRDGTIKIWNWASQIVMESITIRATGPVNNLVYHAASSRLAIAVQDEFGVRILNLGLLEKPLQSIGIETNSAN